MAEMCENAAENLENAAENLVESASESTASESGGSESEDPMNAVRAAAMAMKERNAKKLNVSVLRAAASRGVRARARHGPR